MLKPKVKLTHPNPIYCSILNACASWYYTAGELAEHWRISEGHLSNMRRAGTGPGFTKLPSGRVLYPMSEVLAWELAGQKAAPITMDRIATALATVPGITADLHGRITAHLKVALTS